MDSLFRVEVLSQTFEPQKLIFKALHQDYSEEFVFDERYANLFSEEKSGEIAVERLLKGGKGHWGATEHNSIVFNCGFFPHSVMQQIRTHRVGTSFDVQCLAGDTEVTFVKSSGSLNKIKIAELYDLWANGEKAIRQRLKQGKNGKLPGDYRRDCKTRLKKMPLRVLNETTGFFEIGHIKDVIAKGIQPVYRVTLDDGKTLDCTTNHRLFTAQGWQTMGDAVGLIIGEDGRVVNMTKPCQVMCNGMAVAGNGLYRDKEWLTQQIEQGLYIEVAELSQCSITAVKDWVKKYDLSLNIKNTQFSPDQLPWNARPDALYHNRSWLEAQLSQGLYVDAITQLAGCSISTIKKWVYYYGLSLNKRRTGTRTPWNKNNGGYRLNLSPESREKRRENSKLYTRRGSESNFWKGGTSDERELIGAWTRQTAPQVHKKFNYICQKCNKRGGKLHAHHLVPVYADELLTYEFDNLVTLCKTCHEDIHQNNKELEFAESYSNINSQTWKKRPKLPGTKLQAHPVKVIQVNFLGYQMTYDLEVEGPWHNFVGNGMVVHNSFRYSGQRIVDVANQKRTVEEVFYLRPVGHYTDRQGKKYEYTQAMREDDLNYCFTAACRYAAAVTVGGMSEEHARGIIPFDVRQHWVMSFNARSLMHLLDLRAKADAQLECQQLCELIWPHFEAWMPAIAGWYRDNRWKKARLAP